MQDREIKRKSIRKPANCAGRWLETKALRALIGKKLRFSEAAAAHQLTGLPPGQPIQALLLPVPPERSTFATGQARSCYLMLEHYYSDALLEQFDLKDDPVVADSAVFNIVSQSKKKVAFAEALKDLDGSEFDNFKVLFDRIIHLLHCRPPSIHHANLLTRWRHAHRSSPHPAYHSPIHTE